MSAEIVALPRRAEAPAVTAEARRVAVLIARLPAEDRSYWEREADRWWPGWRRCAGALRHATVLAFGRPGPQSPAD